MAKRVRIANGYDMRLELTRLGARYEASSKTWLLTMDAYDRLYAMYEVSYARSNKRDRALAVAYDRATVTVECDDAPGAVDLAIRAAKDMRECVSRGDVTTADQHMRTINTLLHALRPSEWPADVREAAGL